MKKSTKKKLLLWSKRVAGISAAVLVVRETYLAFGPRREQRRSVFEQALARAKTLGVKLLVLGDPDGGVMNTLLGRQWQCDPSNTVVCIDPRGCGICGNQIQGWPEDVLATMAPHSAVIYDPGAFAMANDGAALATQIARVAISGEAYMADVEPWSLAAFFEPKRKRRLLQAPQVSSTDTIVWQPTWWRTEPSNGARTTQSVALRGLRDAIPAGSVGGRSFGGFSGGMQIPPIVVR